MSNDLMNWHCEIGKPYGDGATLDDVSEAIGAELLAGLWVSRSAFDREQQIKSDLLEALDALVKSHAPDANFPAVNNARASIAKARGEK